VGSKAFDATCPLVTKVKVRVEVGKVRNQTREVVIIDRQGSV